ncbi:MAG: adenylate/guanylate cyclase domain-containing protein [Actinomycetota bacterium]
MSGKPRDPRLAEIAEALKTTRSAAVICDAEWTLVWISDEMKIVLGETDPDALGIGKHMLEAYLSDTWCLAITPETQMRMLVDHFPILIKDTPGGVQRLEEIFREAAASWTEEANAPQAAADADFEAFAHMEPVEPPLVWTEKMDVLLGDLPPLEIVENAVRVRDGSGDLVGTVFLYASALPAHVLAFVARGDEGMFTRMARLVEPGRRQAAILFADLQESFGLSRRLPSGGYFRLVRAITTAIDEVVVRHEGIVGKHAGDGVTAFFLADDLGSSSAAARAAIESAREISEAADRAAKEIAEETGLFDPRDCLVNVAVHWGGTLYIGQLVTGGRLEVTALGDQVNECARMQESVRDGSAIASKTLIEHLADDDARALGIDPDGVVYRPVAELPGASDKAARDAGAIPVTVL